MRLISTPVKCLITAIALMVLVGCATPFKQTPTSTKIDLPTASRLTVKSVMPDGALKSMGIDFVPASVKLNGESVGSFSKNEKSFSYEVNQGVNKLLFCADSCYEYKIDVAPNKHYFLQYEQDRTFAGFVVIYKNSVNILKVEPYQANTAQKGNDLK